MKLPYYRTPERQAALIAEARSWKGTPFYENASVKGAGVDCTRYVAAVHTACGACTGVTVEVLPIEFVRSWHLHNTRSRMVDFFNQPGVRDRIKFLDDGETPMIGDIVVWKEGLCEHHLSLWLGDFIIFSAVKTGVIEFSVHNPEFKKLMRMIVRIMEEVPE